MGAIEDEKIYGLKVRESADDGSDFSNPPADYRLVFVGEDGEWHNRDSSGTVTTMGGVSGTTPTVLLDYTLATDITALSVSSSTWTDIIANQTFTKAQAGSRISISIRTSCFLNAVGSGVPCATRLVIDSAGTPVTEKWGGGTTQAASGRPNPFAGGGVLWLSGLSAAAHTVKPQIYVAGSNSGFYCRASGSADTEFLRIQVIEHL